MLCVDCSIVDGSNKKESHNKKVICQYDYRDATALDELFEAFEIYKRRLQSIEKKCIIHLLLLQHKKGGGIILDFETSNF